MFPNREPSLQSQLLLLISVFQRGQYQYSLCYVLYPLPLIHGLYLEVKDSLLIYTTYAET